MRTIILMVSIVGLLCCAGCASTQRKAEAGCATCIYDMKGVTGCVLAVKIDGQLYLVEGSAIDEHGDAHAVDGLCNTARKATVSGQVKGDKFVTSKIELLP